LGPPLRFLFTTPNTVSHVSTPFPDSSKRPFFRRSSALLKHFMPYRDLESRSDLVFLFFPLCIVWPDPGNPRLIGLRSKKSLLLSSQPPLQILVCPRVSFIFSGRFLSQASLSFSSETSLPPPSPWRVWWYLSMFLRHRPSLGFALHLVKNFCPTLIVSLRNLRRFV